jgi:RNA polymerase sigma-70 factor, ECF subfamily
MLAPVGSGADNAGEGRRQHPMDQSESGSPTRAAFERLVEEYADRIYNVALRITGNQADAEDSMQDAFLQAYRSWSSFRGQSAPTTWLYRIAVNAALRRVQSRRPMEYLTELAVEEDVVDWSGDLAERAHSAEQRERILAGIDLLPPDERAALVLRDVDGLSTAEAAAALEITEQALKSRLHRARVLLRQHLGEYFRER